MTLGLIMIEAMPTHPMGHEWRPGQGNVARHADAACRALEPIPSRHAGVMSDD
jgi:hypothetical protein